MRKRFFIIIEITLFSVQKIWKLKICHVWCETIRIFIDKIIFDLIFFIFENFQNKQIFRRYNISVSSLFFIWQFFVYSNSRQLILWPNARFFSFQKIEESNIHKICQRNRMNIFVFHFWWFFFSFETSVRHRFIWFIEIHWSNFLIFFFVCIIDIQLITNLFSKLNDNQIVFFDIQKSFLISSGNAQNTRKKYFVFVSAFLIFFEFFRRCFFQMFVL